MMMLLPLLLRQSIWILSTEIRASLKLEWLVVLLQPLHAAEADLNVEDQRAKAKLRKAFLLLQQGLVRLLLPAFMRGIVLEWRNESFPSQDQDQDQSQ
jgi:hypothetical protein